MKKSQQVPAALVAALAASFTLAAGCSSTTQRECRDAQGNVLPPSQCRTGGRGAWVSIPRVSSGGFGGTTSRPSGTFGG